MRSLRSSFLCVLLGLLSTTAVSAKSPPPDEPITRVVQPFLNKFCVDCHGAEDQKAERRFDRLTTRIKDDSSLVDYQDIVDQLNLGDMPPEDESQPSEKQRRMVIQFLSSAIERYHETHRGDAETVLRRMNSREYHNTVRDLLSLNMTMFRPTEKFPLDQTNEHLDNVGDTLVTSGHLLARYLEAADLVVAKALHPVEKPKVQTWKFVDGFHQQPEIDQVHKKTNRFKHMTLYDVVGADKPEGAYGPIHAFAKGVPHDGFYEIKIRAEAVNREHPYDPEFLGTDPSEPLRLGIVAGNHEVGDLHLPQPNEPLLAEIELEDTAKWYTEKVWLDEGFTPRFTFRNGLMDARNLWSKLVRRYPDQFPKNLKGIVALRLNAIKHGKLPQIHIHEIEIRGPLYDQWPKSSQVRLLGDDWNGQLNEADVRKKLKRFASRAYRREATGEEVDRLLKVFRIRREAGQSTINAYADSAKAALTSPAFLYLDQSESDGPSPDSKRLTPHALASRLSYFLWSSTPDAKLMRAADSGQILEPGVLTQQVRRMLADPKSDALVDGFLGSWLAMRDLGSTQPDRNDFREFYHYDLDSAMRRETFLFVRDMIDRNEEISKFIDSDYSFVNKPLAQHYGLKQQPSGYGFERVALNDRRRGGLLGQASVLTLTANGVDTSPVVRGVWLLENFLGTPPSPPPPDVEPLDPDARGAKSIRDQLEKHRDNASCYDCHQKIDPLGFALENFDPIGGWRDRYNAKTKIDASGELPGGRKFEDVRELKRILLERQDQFAQALATKMLAYATGRPTLPADRPHINKILAAGKKDGFPFRSMIEQVVISEPFQTK